ncbi:MAG: hypothetical protein QCI82_09315 [Candidatus Thermoplasmatota archaeon]|nr:hypothetical protein [Candidatus Thermoplasmatota archaeon]
MRILHVNNQASVAYLISRAQRRAGHVSDLLAVPTKYQEPPDHAAPNVRSLFLKLLRIAPRYDLIHVHGGIGISGAALLPYRAIGKRFISHYHGSELREGKQTSFHILARAIFVSTPDLLEMKDRVGGRDPVWIPNPVEVEKTPLANVDLGSMGARGGRPMTIAHMPSRREVKGTRNVIRAVEEANRGGAHYVLDIIEGLPLADAKRRLSKAHLCVDWMSEDYRIHGVVSLEAMARGIPTICNIDRSLYPKDIPIIASAPKDLAGVLLKIWDEPEHLKGIPAGSRDYVLEHHHPDRVAELIEPYL